MNARKFNLLCITAVVVTCIIAILAVQLSSGSRAIEAPSNIDIGQLTSNSTGAIIQPLSLPLALAIIFDMGLMTLGLVILFSDDGPRRHRLR